MRKYRYILPLIVISQFCCTSLWFAGNAVLPNLAKEFHLPTSALGHLTSAVQVGFITGTLVFALFTVSDRFSPSRIFMVCSLLGAFFNLGTVLHQNNFSSLLMIRFLTGFFLAGIYPVGMKIAADYFEKGLGKSLGYLVGALVLGTAFPHLLKNYSGTLSWTYLVGLTSALAFLGGLLIVLFVPDGPYRRAGQKPDFTRFLKVFGDHSFRRAAFGYFGHMWELYAFWAFIPVMFVAFQNMHPETNVAVSLWSFLVIAAGGPACVVSGYLSQYFGPLKTARFALFASGMCCFLSPLLLMTSSLPLFVMFLIFWGIVVVADSPLFSTLVARYAEPSSKGTALTIVNCIGFSVSIVSIQLLNTLYGVIHPFYLFVPLGVGPLLGLTVLFGKKQKGIES